MPSYEVAQDAVDVSGIDCDIMTQFLRCSHPIFSINNVVYNGMRSNGMEF